MEALYGAYWSLMQMYHSMIRTAERERQRREDWWKTAELVEELNEDQTSRSWRTADDVKTNGLTTTVMRGGSRRPRSDLLWRWPLLVCRFSVFRIMFNVKMSESETSSTKRPFVNVETFILVFGNDMNFVVKGKLCCVFQHVRELAKKKECMWEWGNWGWKWSMPQGAVKWSLYKVEHAPRGQPVLPGETRTHKDPTATSAMTWQGAAMTWQIASRKIVQSEKSKFRLSEQHNDV